MRKFIITFFVILSFTFSASAHVVLIGDVYYDIDYPSRSAEVSYRVHEYYSGYITVPGKVNHNGNTYKVTEIGGHAFSSCKDLISVIILEGPTYIGSGAFNNCKGLKTVTLPGSISDIKDGAFYGCYNLERIYVPRGQKNRFAAMAALREFSNIIIEK